MYPVHKSTSFVHIFYSHFLNTCFQTCFCNSMMKTICSTSDILKIATEQIVFGYPLVLIKYMAMLLLGKSSLPVFWPWKPLNWLYLKKWGSSRFSLITCCEVRLCLNFHWGIEKKQKQRYIGIILYTAISNEQYIMYKYEMKWHFQNI